MTSKLLLVAFNWVFNLRAKWSIFLVLRQVMTSLVSPESINAKHPLGSQNLDICISGVE